MIQIALSFLNPRLRVSYTDNFTGAVAVVTVPFNRYLKGNKPDDTNYALGRKSALLARSFDLPVIGQWEQISLIDQIDRVRTLQYPVTSGDGEWVKTNELMQWIAKQVRSLGQGNRVILILHPHHVRRGSILARYYGLEPLVPREVEEIPYDPRHHPGYQWWCTSAWVYVPWEYCSRLVLALKVFLGKL